MPLGRLRVGIFERGSFEVVSETLETLDRLLGTAPANIQDVSNGDTVDPRFQRTGGSVGVEAGCHLHQDFLRGILCIGAHLQHVQGQVEDPTFVTPQ